MSVRFRAADLRPVLTALASQCRVILVRTRASISWPNAASVGPMDDKIIAYAVGCNPDADRSTTGGNWRAPVRRRRLRRVLRFARWRVRAASAQQGRPQSLGHPLPHLSLQVVPPAQSGH